MADTRIKDIAANASTIDDADELIIDSVANGTQRITWAEVKSEVGADYNVVDFGADPTGAVDSSVAIQAAIDASFADIASVNGVSHRPRIYIPAGSYRISTSLNCQRRTAPDTVRNEGLYIYGDGPHSTTLLGETPGYPVIDTLGMNYLTLRDFRVSTYTGSTSSCALLIGRRTDAENGGFNSIERIYTRGDFTVSHVYALNAEVTRYDHCTFKNQSNTNDCTTFISAISAVNHTGVDIVSAYYTITSVGAGDRNTQVTYDTCAFQNNDDRANNRVIRLEKPKGHLFINCGNYAGFTTADQPLIEIAGKSEDNTFIGLRQEYGATRLVGVYYEFTNAAGTEDCFNTSFINCSMAPIYGEDNIRFSALQLNAVKWYTPDVADTVLDVYDLYDATIQNTPNVFSSGSKTRVDGIFTVRNNAARSNIKGVTAAQINVTHPSLETEIDFIQNIQVHEGWLGFSPLASSTADAYIKRIGTARIGTDTDWYIGGSLNAQAVDTASDGDATPSVADTWVLKTANTSPTTITTFLNSLTGHQLILIFGDALTTMDFSGTNLKGNNGVDWLAPQDSVLFGVYDGTNWRFQSGGFGYNLGPLDVTGALTGTTAGFTGALTGTTAAFTSATAPVIKSDGTHVGTGSNANLNLIDNTVIPGGAAGSSTYRGLAISPNLGSTEAVDNFYGLSATPQLQSSRTSGTLDVMSGVLTQPNIGTVAGSTITVVRGVDIQNVSTSGTAATVTTQTGLHISNQTEGATNNFGIYNAHTGDNYFAGDIQLLGDLQVSGSLDLASSTPASASATGTTGTIAWDADYIYVCTATDTWKRVAIATWP